MKLLTRKTSDIELRALGSQTVLDLRLAGMSTCQSPIKTWLFRVTLSQSLDSWEAQRHHYSNFVIFVFALNAENMPGAIGIPSDWNSSQPVQTTSHHFKPWNSILRHTSQLKNWLTYFKEHQRESRGRTHARRTVATPVSDATGCHLPQMPNSTAYRCPVKIDVRWKKLCPMMFKRKWQPSVYGILMNSALIQSQKERNKLWLI